MERKYSYKDVDMLMASRVLCQNFRKQKTKIVTIRSFWADPFIDDFETRVTNAMESILGQDAKKGQKLATQEITEVQEQALDNLSLFKVQVEADYAGDRPRRKWLLDTLGFTGHWKSSSRGKDQEALIQLLAQFKENMDDELKKEITEKGTGEALIDNIIAHAPTMREADVKQEDLKEASQDLTAESVEELNGIYAQSMNICKIASRIFKSRPRIARNFSFAHIVRTLNNPRREVSEDRPPVDPSDI